MILLIIFKTCASVIIFQRVYQFHYLLWIVAKHSDEIPVSTILDYFGLSTVWREWMYCQLPTPKKTQYFPRLLKIDRSYSQHFINSQKYSTDPRRYWAYFVYIAISLLKSNFVRPKLLRNFFHFWWLLNIPQEQCCIFF